MLVSLDEEIKDQGGVTKQCHKTAYNLNIHPLYKMNICEENFSEMI